MIARIQTTKICYKGNTRSRILVKEKKTLSLNFPAKKDKTPGTLLLSQKNKLWSLTYIHISHWEILERFFELDFEGKKTGGVFFSSAISNGLSKIRIRDSYF